MALPEVMVSQSMPLRRAIAPRNRFLEHRVAVLQARVLGSARARGSIGIEGLLCNDGATVIFYGRVSSESVPQLVSVLEGIVQLRLPRLTVDLTATTAVSPDALIAIARFEDEVSQLTVRLPNVVPDFVQLAKEELSNMRFAPLGR